MKRGIIIIILILLILPFVSAGILDFFKKNILQKGPSDTQEFTTTLNDQPSINVTFIDNNNSLTMDNSITLIPGSLSVGVNVSLNITDKNGVSDINGSLIGITLDVINPDTNPNEVRRFTTGNSTCAGFTSNGVTLTLNCTVIMKFFDQNTFWNVTVNITDFGGPIESQKNNRTFTVEQLKDITVDPATVSLGTISVGLTNILSLQNSSINNTGNFEVPGEGSFFIKSENLTGQTDASQNINGSNFRVNGILGAGDVCNGGTRLVEHVSTAVTNVTLPKGIEAFPFGANENITHCLTSHDVTIAQVYSTVGFFPWTFTI